MLKFKQLNFFKILNLLLNGANLKSPFSIHILGELKFGKNITIGRHVTFSGDVSIEDGTTIEDYCLIKDAYLSKNSRIKSHSIVEDSRIGKMSFIGPFARVRGNSLVGDECQIGNFVELKNSFIGLGCRINHMAFIGDATLEDDVTIGAGTITCNHDGHKVNKTLIKEKAYIGSNVNLVAPIIIAARATIGSGSTITDDVPENSLTIARSKQVTIENWEKPKK